jgi:hypothetical protein
MTHSGIVVEAAIRLAIWSARGSLEHRGGWSLGRSLQNVFFPRAVRASEPWRGLELLRAIDATRDVHGVSMTVDLVQVRAAPRLRVSLADRCEQIRK